MDLGSRVVSGQSLKLLKPTRVSGLGFRVDTYKRLRILVLRGRELGHCLRVFRLEGSGSVMVREYSIYWV